MKDKDSPLNFFQSSAKKKKIPTEPPAQASSKDKLVPVTTPKLPTLQKDPEVTEMLKKIEDMRNDIEQQIEFISRQSGWSKEKIWQFTNDPKNFSSEQWAIVQNENKAFVDKVWAAVAPAIEIHKDQAKKSQEVKDRKGKFIGSRRKWINTK